MKSLFKYAFFVGVLLFLLTSCSSVSLFTLEVQKPALITLPLTSRDVVVLNNAVSQPSDQNVIRKYKQQLVENDPIEFDTTSWVAVYTIADILSESDFFDNVEVYTKPIRDDNEFLAQVNLSEEVLSDFFTDLDYDMIVSVDRLVFSIEETANPIAGDSDERKIKQVMLHMTTHAVISCGVYLKGRTSPLTTFNVRDSLKYSSFLDATPVEIFKSLPESFLEILSVFMAEVAANKLIPSWESADRLLFTSTASRMKEAFNYANTSNWDRSIEIWESLLKEKTKPLDKARLASNLAVGYEVKEKLDESLQWAQQSQAYFKEAGKSASKEEQDWIESYIPQLENRFQDNKLLDIQWGAAED